MFGPMQQVGQPPFLAPPGLGQMMMNLTSGQPQVPMPPSLQLPGMNKAPDLMPPWPPKPAHPLLKMTEGGDPSLPPMMWLPEEPLGANPEMQVFGQQPGMMPGAAPEAAAPQESVWGRMANNLMNDRALQLGLMAIGLNMMQPIQPGQTSMGHLASAIGQGINTIGQQRGIEENRKLQERKMGLEERQVGQGDRRLDLTQSGQDAQNQQTNQRIALDQRRVDLEGRRVDVSEATAGSTIASQEQEREQKGEAFPLLQRRLEADIGRLRTQGQLDEANAALIGEKAKLYPEEVRIGLMNAQSSRISANAAAQNARSGAQRAATDAAKANEEPAQLRIMRATAKAMVASGKAKDENEALAMLGTARPGGSSTAGQVQTANEAIEAYKTANPRRQDESEEAFNQRVAAEKHRFLTTQKGKEPDYLESLAAFTKNAMPGEEAQAREEHDRIWAAQGRQVPGSEKRQMRNEVSMKEVEDTAKARGIPKEEVIRLLKQRNPNLVVK